MYSLLFNCENRKSDFWFAKVSEIEIPLQKLMTPHGLAGA